MYELLGDPQAIERTTKERGSMPGIIEWMIVVYIISKQEFIRVLYNRNGSKIVRLHRFDLERSKVFVRRRYYRIHGQFVEYIGLHFEYVLLNVDQFEGHFDLYRLGEMTVEIHALLRCLNT